MSQFLPLKLYNPDVQLIQRAEISPVDLRYDLLSSSES